MRKSTFVTTFCLATAVVLGLGLCNPSVAQDTDIFSVNFYAYGKGGDDFWGQEAWRTTITLESEESAGYDDWDTTGWENITVPWAPNQPRDPVTITSNQASTATFTFKDARNGGPFYWTQTRDPATHGDGNATLLDGHVNSTGDPLDGSNICDIEVTDIPFDAYDVIIYMGINDGQKMQGSGKLVFNGVEQDIKVLTTEPDGTFVEMADATTPGNYIVFEGLTDPSFSVQTWGTDDAHVPQWTHLGPAGFQFREALSFDPTDFDQDGDSDLVDINALTAAADLPVGVPVPLVDAKFDLTGDEIVNSADLDKWLADAATINGFGSPYLKGDTNIDGDVDVWAFDGSGDAQVLSENLGTMTDMVWGDGDFNGDGDVDVWAFDGSGDAQQLSSNLGSTNDAAAGSAEAIYNALTGELTFDIGEGVAVVGIMAADMKHDAVDESSPLGTPVQNGNNILAYFDASGLPAGMSSVGAVLPTGLTDCKMLSFSYTPVGHETQIVPVTIIVPEPSTIAMLVIVGLVGVFLRRRNG